MAGSKPKLADIARGKEDRLGGGVAGRLAASSVSGKPASVLKVRRADEITPCLVNWLWPGRIPFGMLTLLDGDPGLGKSTITAHLAACLTTGLPMPGAAGPTCDPAGVLLLAAEDSAEHTITPRLRVAGADLSRCHILDALDVGGRERPVRLPDDLSPVEQFASDKRVKLIVIDPLMSYLSGGIDSNSDQSAREVLHALKLAAERTGAAILCLRHLNKRQGGPALYRGGGSIAFTAAARSALAVAKHPEQSDSCVLASVKCNLAARPKALEYEVADAGGIPRVQWGRELDLDADELLAPPEPPRRGDRKDEAVAFLRAELRDGPRSASETQARAEAEGITEKTLRRAREELGVTADKTSLSPYSWTWRLPEPTQPPATDPDQLFPG